MIFDWCAAAGVDAYDEAAEAPFEILSFSGAFHGRTMGALALTAKQQYKTPFLPVMPGTVQATYMDLASAAALIKKVCVCALIKERSLSHDLPRLSAWYYLTGVKNCVCWWVESVPGFDYDMLVRCWFLSCTKCSTQILHSLKVSRSRMSVCTKCQNYAADFLDFIYSISQSLLSVGYFVKPGLVLQLKDIFPSPLNYCMQLLQPGSAGGKSWRLQTLNPTPLWPKCRAGQLLFLWSRFRVREESTPLPGQSKASMMGRFPCLSFCCCRVSSLWRGKAANTKEISVCNDNTIIAWAGRCIFLNFL